MNLKKGFLSSLIVFGLLVSQSSALPITEAIARLINASERIAYNYNYQRNFDARGGVERSAIKENQNTGVGLKRNLRTMSNPSIANNLFSTLKRAFGGFIFGKHLSLKSLFWGRK